MAVSQKSHLPALLWLLRTYGESILEFLQTSARAGLPSLSSILPCADTRPASQAYRSEASRTSPFSRRYLFGQARGAVFCVQIGRASFRERVNVCGVVNHLEAKAICHTD